MAPTVLLDLAPTASQVMLQVFVFAFLVVILSAVLTTPVLLYGLGLAAHGWRWQHGALFRWGTWLGANLAQEWGGIAGVSKCSAAAHFAEAQPCDMRSLRAWGCCAMPRTPTAGRREHGRAAPR